MVHAMTLVRADAAARGGRSIAIAHCFAAGVEVTPGVEREIRQGGLDVVPLSAFDGPDYVALGHIHGRQQLSERVRYAGAPLRSEEHTSELQSLMRISYAVFCLKKKTHTKKQEKHHHSL